jgi:hypothetical protein
MATSILPVRRCALCGKQGRSLVAFALLAEVCRRAGIKLKVCSDHFHPSCARKVFVETIKSRSENVVMLHGRTG